MKKYIILAIAIVLSACVTTSPRALSIKLCSNGDHPTKTVSADGSYYIWACANAGASAQSNSTVTVDADRVLLPNGLKQIKVIKDWEPVTNFAVVKDYAFNEYKFRWFYNEHESLDCYNRITKVTPYPGKNYSNSGSDPSTQNWQMCQGMYHDKAQKNPQLIGDIMLAWASNPIDPMVVIHNPKLGMQTAGYQLPSTLGTFAQFYAMWYDEIAYTPEDRELVDAYMTRKLMEQKFPPLASDYRGKMTPCNINDINSILNSKAGSNNCAGIRWKVSVGEIMLGFRLENQKLLDKGHDDIYVVWAFINKDGVNIQLAAKGAGTVNYSWDYSHYMTILAEIYRSVGYDFYEHTLPHGAKVHEYLDFNYRLLKDFTLTKQWAVNNKGSDNNQYRKIANMSQIQFQLTTRPYSYKYGDLEFIKTHTGFVKRYMPELYSKHSAWEKRKLGGIKSFMNSDFMIGSNRGISPFMLYLGNLE